MYVSCKTKELVILIIIYFKVDNYETFFSLSFPQSFVVVNYTSNTLCQTLPDSTEVTSRQKFFELRGKIRSYSQEVIATWNDKSNCYGSTLLF